MLHHFFLSYSRADDSPLLKKFFDDLSDTIRIKSNLPRTQTVGFYKETEYGPTSDWGSAEQEALRDSGMMVCLLSPSYMHCERTGKEWQIFDMRWRMTLAGPEVQGPLPKSLAQLILPVTWKSWHGPVPGVINELLAHPEHIHQRQALITMLKSSGIALGEYSEFVKTLADQIIEMTPAATNVPRLDSLPPMSEVSSAFHLWEEEAAGSDPSVTESRRHEISYSHDEFIRPVARKGQPSMASEIQGAISLAEQKESGPNSRQENQTDKYLVFAISKEAEILSRIRQCCPSSSFDLRTFEDPHTTLEEIETLLTRGHELPDLFVIDLDIGTEVIDLTKRLSEKMKLPSEILLLSSSFDGRSLNQFGGHTILSKSSLRNQLCTLINSCAEIGSDRIDFRKTRVLNRKRFDRQVFLSYCHKDRTAATFLIRNFEARGIWVWNMDDTLQLGDDCYFEIVNGLDKARILVSLITNNYLSSMFCKGELFSFYVRLKLAQCKDGRPHLIPVLYDSPNIDDYQMIIKPYQYLEMNRRHYIGELRVLTRRIQNLLLIK